MIRKVTAFIEEYHMIEEGDLVAAGISGGADSMCLLLVLMEYRKKVPFDLIVVHVNHKIREDAKADAAFVEDCCKKYNLPFFLWEEDVERVARKEKISVEEAGRKVRYQAFDAALKKYKKDDNRKKGSPEKIAVAHNQGDCAETMLFHLFRGTGVSGMAGILPVRDGIIRPLLTTSRQEIEVFLKENGMSWCIDSTNEEDTYTRNKIRRHILPFAEQEIVKGAASHVAEAAMQMVQVREYLEQETAKAAGMCAKISPEEKEVEIDLKSWENLPKLIQNQVILWALEKASPGRKDITSSHVQSLRRLTQKGGSKRIDLPGKLEGVKEYETLWIRRKKVMLDNLSGKADIIQEMNVSRESSIIMQVPGKYPLGNGEFLELTLTDLTKVGIIEEKKYTKYLDYDKIYNYLTLRFRQSGDYLTINDAGQKKSLKEYFIQEKIPASIRDEIPVVADGKHILWVTGHRISAYYKVTEKTKNILQMTIRRE